MLTSAAVKAQALAMGFDACGVAPVTGIPELARLREWVGQGYAGDMRYLADTLALRDDARGGLPSAQSVIVTATLYNTAEPYTIECTDQAQAHVARYAWGADYHPLITSRLDKLIGWMHAEWTPAFEACPYVDTGPVQERVYARYAGIGWAGKNTCVIHPTLGSWIFLGVILCSLPLEPDEPSVDQCGSCSLCLEACPTQAFPAPGVLDARRCISYLTIEQNQPIPEELREAVGARIYGCDVCQEVCPYNLPAPVSADPAWQPRAEWRRPDVFELVRRSDQALRASLKGSAMQRAGVKNLKRNISVAVGNRGDAPEPGRAV